MPIKDDETLPQDEEVKRAAEVREWIESKISELEQEISRLRSMLLLVDSTLRRRSFVSAKELRKVETSTASQKRPRVEDTLEKREMPEPPIQKPKSPQLESKELRRSSDGEILASAKIGPEKILITPSAKIKLSEKIPPFESFFVNRILKGYQSKDIEASKAGMLPATDVLQYDVKTNEGIIAEVTIVNYRDKTRLNEILNTATWAFTRMLEKK